ncbi:MAG: hemolysin family protein [Acidimicrobiales bacterium]
MGASGWLLVAAFTLLVVIAVLTTAEAALGRTSVVRLESLDDEGSQHRRVRRAVDLLENPEAILNPLRMVIVGAQLAHATLVATATADLFGARWVWLSTALDIALVFVVAEAGARTMGILHADRAALALARPVAALVGSPPVRLLAALLVWLSNVMVPGKGLQTGPFAHPEELIALADAAVEDSVLEQDERDLIESVIEFGDTIVREVMVPRTDMITLDREVSVAAALEVASEAGFSRLPAEGDNIDDIIGLVYVKDLIRAELDGSHDDPIGGFLRPARFVPETKKVSDLLKEMQTEKFHMAIAVDEYGGIAGLATLEDLIEELVGEIVDEYDVDEPLVERQRDGSLRVDARMPIDELNHVAGMALPEGEWDTVGGLVFDGFGRVPSEGERCEVDGYELEAERVKGRRITRVRVARRQLNEVTEDAHAE